MSTVLAKPTQPAAPITPGAAPVAAPGATSTTMNEQQKKIFIIVGAVAGFLVLFGIVYGVLSSAVFSAKSVANSYVAAISSGNYDKANTIADPHVNTNQRALLTSKASSGEEFKNELDAYIIHWNTRRRQIRLEGHTPEEFRNMSLTA